MQSRRKFLKTTGTAVGSTAFLSQLSFATGETATKLAGVQEALPFGEEFSQLEMITTGEWWTKPKFYLEDDHEPGKTFPPLDMDVPRDEVIAFALYAQDKGVLKITGQLYPLLPEEEMSVSLEFKVGEEWQQVTTSAVEYPGWSVHFRVEDWDASLSVAYRLRHGKEAIFEGFIRADPVDKEQIVIASMSCNSRFTTGPRDNMIKSLRELDPDMLFFAGDQTYHHTEHTSGWIEFGLQFRDVMKDRPTITIVDDHDVGQGNIWGAGGVPCKVSNQGGYIFPAKYVNMVQRQQTWHLPDAVDPEPIEQGIEVYWTRLRLGEIDFAILEDRKFKSGPKGVLPKEMAPRPDHLTSPDYEYDDLDKEGLELLGERQLKFLSNWSQDWEGAEMKAVLSQTPFANAAHIHGAKRERLYADLDSNGWPRSGRNAALKEIRRAWAPHICGDQHLATVLKHGIENAADGPYSVASPAIVNTVYPRGWEPLEEELGNNPVKGSPLAWTGDFIDGFGNHIRMIAYANFQDEGEFKRDASFNRGDGFNLVRFNKKTRDITFECWPRYVDLSEGDAAQYPGWPVTFNMRENDGRKVTHWLPPLQLPQENLVVQVKSTQADEILYTVRVQGNSFQPTVYGAGSYQVLIAKESILAAKDKAKPLSFEANDNAEQETVKVSADSVG